MKRTLLVILLLVLFAVPPVGAAPIAAPDAAISLGAAYAQNFNTLATSGTGNAWADDSTIPGWYSTRTTYTAGTGSSNAGALYSFGLGVSTERALGSVASDATTTVRYGVRFMNNTGNTVTSITVSYIGEQWRNSGNTTQHKLSFDYQIGATVTSLTTGTWTPVTALDFTGPIATAMAAALDGNAAANRAAISASFAVSIAPNQEIMLRWNDPNETGSDHGLSIDDLTVEIAPTVSSTAPANGATSIAPDANIDITFSEAVNVAAGWYTISCGTSGPHTATVSGSSPTWTLNPDADFSYGETCTVTIVAANVTDQDAFDPPDTMVPNYVFTFTVDIAPSVSTTTPATGAIDVAVNAAIIVNFSEPVNVTTNSFTIVCPSGTHTFGLSVSGSTATLTPDSNFANSETCTVTVVAAQVSDADTGDPPDKMVSDYIFTFTTSTADPAPAVSVTDPANAAPNVVLDTNISVTFSEAVNVTGSWYGILCGTSGSHAAAASGGPTTFVFDPTTDFSAGESCTVTVYAAQVTDQDTNDPWDNMAADYSWTFTIDAAPSVSSTTPATSATGVAVNADITVNFSEPVNVTTSSFTIVCPSGTHTFVLSGSVASYTLNPDINLTGGESCTVTVIANQVSDADANDPPDNMTADYAWTFTTVVPVATNVIINELDADQTSTDTAEFVELYDGGAGNTSLGGLVVVFYNGSNDLSYAAYDLDGRSTGANGYFLLGNSGVSPTPGIAFANDFLQNGADAVALYSANGSDFPTGTAVTTNNLVDAIVYDTSDADDAGLLVLLNAGQPQVDENRNSTSVTQSNQRCPNGSGGQRNTSTYLQHTPTAGATNNCPEYDPPRVSSTAPTSGATGIGTNTTITINFNEIVDVGAGAFTVACPVGAVVDFTVNPILPANDTSSVVLTPSSALPASTICTVTAVATQITDNDGTIHQLDGNGDGTGGDSYSFTFTTATVDPCTLPATPIYQIQGSGASSPLVNTALDVEGIVVGDFQGTTGLNGFYLQDPTGDSNTGTSDGIFVYVPSGNPLAGINVQVGDAVHLKGTVKEFNGLTEIDTLTALTLCGTGSVAATAVGLPEAANGDLEKYEGMLITFPETLTVSQNYFQGRYGEVTLSSEGRMYNPTNGNDLGDTVDLNARRILVLDDGHSGENPNPTPYIGADNTLRVGDTVAGLTGTLDYGLITSDSTTRDYRLQPTQAVSFTRTNARTAAPDSVGGSIKVASFNVLNYFTNLGCGDPCRGADNATEFDRQRKKIIKALAAIDADVVGLMEIENNGATAVGDLVAGLNAEIGGTPYTYVAEPAPGTDGIKVAMIYKPGTVTPTGAAQNYQTSTAAYNPLFDRPPLAQTFTVLGTGEKFTVVVNHFKSKGSCPTSGDDVDTGQGCWNTKRVAQATGLLGFIATLQATDPDVLVIGDLNAYGAEDPIKTLVTGGLINEVGKIPAAQRYSYVFDGQSGYLDQGLATSSLDIQISGRTIWHINADEPLVIDYNTEYKAPLPNYPPDLYTPTPYRSSDHDPVIVGLDLMPPPPTPVPTLSEWGMLLLAGLVAGYGAWTLRRRQRPQAG